MEELYRAVERRNIDTAKTLLARGTDANSTTPSGIGVFHLISMTYKVTDIIGIPFKYEDTFLIHEYNYAPLEKDQEAKTLEMAGLLLKSKANINMMSLCGSTPLHIASKYNNDVMVKFLLEKGADLNVIDSYNNTPLFYSAYSGNVSTTRLLLDYGAKLHSRNKDECTPLHYAVNSNNNELIRLLLDRGSVVNAVDRYNSSVLHKAINRQNLNIIKTLLDEGIDCNLKDNHGHTALHYAICQKNNELTNMLLCYGADPNLKDIYYHTPLYNAMLCSYPENIETLLEFDADVNALDDLYKTPLTNARVDRVTDSVALKVISHLSFLESFNSIVTSSTGYKLNRQFIKNNERYSLMKQKCNNEIKMLKSIKLSKYSAEIFLSSKNINLLAKLVHHPTVKRFHVDFPIYCYKLRKSIETGIARRKWLDKGMKALESFDLFRVLPSYTKRDILEYLTQDDIQSLLYSKT
ncbi:ORF-146 [Teiidae poxvirus 1]|nr:ORF-146 [Teiidae poxvirus 1]